EFHHAMDLLGALRLCANVPGQFAIEAALHGADTIGALCAPGGRLHEARRAVVESCAASKHLERVAPFAALYGFPGVTVATAEGFEDNAYALELLESLHVLIVPGSSSYVPYRTQIRVYLLPQSQAPLAVFARTARVLSRRVVG